MKSSTNVYLRISLILGLFCIPLFLNCNMNKVKNDSGISPLIDLHVHLSDNLTIDQAVALSQKKGIQFGIVAHPGVCEYCPISNDSLLREYITMLRKYPVYVGLQPVFPGWQKLFSKDLLDQLDYIIMDALEIPQKDGSIWRIWLPDTKVDDVEAFMKMYVDYNVQIVSESGVDVLANATYLPKCLEKDYIKLWTRERMQQVIDAANAHHVAIEINGYYKVPDISFIKLAKASGAKFSFGTNSRNSFAGNLDYCLKVARECGIRQSDMFFPKNLK